MAQLHWRREVHGFIDPSHLAALSRTNTEQHPALNMARNCPIEALGHVCYVEFQLQNEECESGAGAPLRE